MHRLPSLHVVRKFRFGAILFLGVGLLMVCGMVLTIHGLAFHTEIRHRHLEMHQTPTLLDEWRLWSGLGLLVASLLLSLVQRVLADRAKCPLCMTPPLVHRACQRSRHARTLLGSYRLRVAMGVFFRGCFTCPYCGEATRCEVRPRGYASQNSYGIGTGTGSRN